MQLKVKLPYSLRTTQPTVAKDKISPPISLPSPSSGTANTPKQVIKALYDYQAHTNYQISFQQGDFFHVLSQDKEKHWYEVINPTTMAKGVVPSNHFQVLEKTEQSWIEGSLCRTESAFLLPHPTVGVVLYDFEAERSEELSTKAGEPILIIAQSNPEWFVARPMGRLGGPGLIPVSFVEIKDVIHGPNVASKGGRSLSTPSSPKIEAWQETATDTTEKRRSVSSMLRLKRISVHDTITSFVNRQETALRETMSELSLSSKEKSAGTDKKVVSVTVTSYVGQEDQYWFIVVARMKEGRYRVLYRLYEDFYDFQVYMMKEYPREAGASDGKRILPLLHEPLKPMNEQTTASCQVELNLYCEKLMRLPDYIVECCLVQNLLFGLREGDIELDSDPRTPSSCHSSLYGTYINKTLANRGAFDSNGSTRPAPKIVPWTDPSSSMIKVKLAYKQEMFALKVPTECTLDQLKTKVHTRLGFRVQLFSMDTPRPSSILLLDTEEEFQHLLASSLHLKKLTLRAEEED
ncbi:hypothetical protein BDF14DRAFT_1768726 [Spinellus fusiger]|nr:hypothetical protein BDF14DRAFT_1768726 [Spinellus fusiger]